MAQQTDPDGHIAAQATQLTAQVLPTHGKLQASDCGVASDAASSLASVEASLGSNVSWGTDSQASSNAGKA